MREAHGVGEGENMLSRISKFAIGILFIPFVIGVTMSLFETLGGIGEARYTGARIFLWGVLAYTILHLFIHKASYIYTFGHEVTHVLATWLCGGGVKSFSVSKKGGSVETTKSNFFITLSPYFVPTYTLILSLLYFVIPFFVKIPSIKAVYLFLAGFTLALHLIFTAEVLRLKQPDIINTGYLFSMAIIYVVNVILAAFILSLLFEGVAFEDFFYGAYLRAKNIYVNIFRQLFVI